MLAPSDRGTLNAERTRALAASRAAEAAAAGARAELHAQQARLQRVLDEHHQLAQEKLMVTHPPIVALLLRPRVCYHNNLPIVHQLFISITSCPDRRSPVKRATTE